MSRHSMFLSVQTSVVLSLIALVTVMITLVPACPKDKSKEEAYIAIPPLINFPCSGTTPLGDEYFAKGQLEKAIRSYRFDLDSERFASGDAAKLHRSLLFARLAWCSSLLGRLDQAESHANAARALSPQGCYYSNAILPRLVFSIACMQRDWKKATSLRSASKYPMDTVEARTLEELANFKLNGRINHKPLDFTKPREFIDPDNDDTKFYPSDWKKSWTFSDASRKKYANSLLKSPILLGLSKWDARQLLGPPSFSPENNVFADYYPLGYFNSGCSNNDDLSNFGSVGVYGILVIYGTDERVRGLDLAYDSEVCNSRSLERKANDLFKKNSNIPQRTPPKRLFQTTK